MNRFTEDNLRAIKARVERGTGLRFGAAEAAADNEAGAAHVANRGLGRHVLRTAIAFAIIATLGCLSVFAVKHFTISKGVLEAPAVDETSAEQIAANSVDQPEDYGIYDLNGNPVSPDDPQVFTDQDGNLVYPEPVPELQAASVVYEGPEFGSLNGFTISFPFGETGNSRGTLHHDGIDLVADKGTPVLAAAPGTVRETGFTPAYGNYVTIDHEEGYSTLYAHLSEILTEAGAAVETGDRIGTVGASGMATGPCLHFELRLNGEPIDPADYWE